jgi:hypothetical protein
MDKLNQKVDSLVEVAQPVRQCRIVQCPNAVGYEFPTMK